jgi:tryptophan-rich sensory protein
MALCKQVLLGIAAFVIVFLFWPVAKKAMEQSKQAENPDWNGVLLPIGIVIFFIFMLIMISRG